MSTPNPILDTALELHQHGYSVLPIRPDGTKAPALAEWRRYLVHRPTTDQLHQWFDQPGYGLGIVQGAVSGDVELTEIEGRAAHHLPALTALATESGLGELWARITAGWTEMSPSGGFHFHTRLDGAPVPGNTHIARRPSTDEELAAWKERETEKAQTLDPDIRAKRLEKIAETTHEKVPQVLIETRGEGGQVVAHPTPGTMHPSGRPWLRLTGGPATAAVLTLDERAAFHALLATLDTMPARTTPETPERTPGPRAPHDGLTPGDDYEQQVDWAQILQPHGWTHHSTRGTARMWTRPGKDTPDGISASTGHADDRDRLYVFTSSTEFEQNIPYTKLGALAVLEHGGDHSAAAKALARDGYGEPATRLAPADDLAGLIAPVESPTASAAPLSTPTPTITPGQAPGAAPAGNPPADTPTAVTTPARPAVAVVVEERPAAPNQDNTALLLVDRHQHEIRYCPGRGTWLTWTGHRWTNDDTEHIRELARSIARRLPTRDGWEKYTKGALTANGISGILRLAQSDARIVAPAGQLDARPYELNTPAGVIDLRTGNLTPPDPAALHTRSTTIAPDLNAPHPRWDAFLADTFAGNPTMTTYIQRLLGLSIVGVVLEQLFPFAHGVGANGKSTLLSVIQHLVGLGDTGYAASAPASMLLATRSEGHPTELARLSGARLVVTSELEDNQRFAEAKIKLLTGKDTISGRFMRQDWFDFTPTHTLWLLANHQPEVRAGGVAFWRRIRLLPFEHTVPPERRVPDLEDKLIAEEGPAILGWLIRGARDYFAHGLAEPDSVRAATAAYQLDQDTIARFVAECCETGNPSAQHLKVKSGTLRAAYETWCRIEGEDPDSVKAMTIALKTRFGVIPERSMSARFLAGIRLTDDTTEDDDDPSSHEPPRDHGTHQQEGW